MDNLLASLGDFFFLIHDWLFTEQFINVSLIVPIAVRAINNNEDPSRAKEKATKFIATCSAVFYVLLVGWFILSAVNGSFFVRQTYNVVMVYMAVVFVMSMFRIRGMFFEDSSLGQLKRKENLMNFHLVFYLSAVFVSLVTLTLAYFKTQQKDGIQNATPLRCRLEITFDIFYWFIWLIFLSRTCLTSYMNIQFSRSLKQTNREFMMVFNRTVSSVMLVVQDEHELE